ncbi:MAG: hypothetical protein Q9168_006847 [Polycauliona sp. 1 TL-2023]
MSFSRLGYSSRLIATIAVLLHIVTSVSANCFLPNGTDRNSIWDSHPDDYQPSGFGSPDDDFQMCCATKNRPNPDTPRKDGLCQSQSEDQIWRESCTDPTWKSPSCVKLCIAGTNDQGESYGDLDMLITECSDLSYCCGDKNTTCCDQGNGVWLKDGEPTTINPNSTRTTTDAATLASTTASDAVQTVTVSSPHSKSTNGLGKPAIAGIAVGAVAGAAILALSIWLFLHQRKRRRRGDVTPSNAAPEFMYANQSPTDTKAPGSMSQYPTNGDSKEGMSIQVASPLDKEGGVLRSELYGDNDKDLLSPRAELAGEDRRGYMKDEPPAVELAGCMPAYREME